MSHSRIIIDLPAYMGALRVWTRVNICEHARSGACLMKTCCTTDPYFPYTRRPICVVNSCTLAVQFRCTVCTKEVQAPDSTEWACLHNESPMSSPSKIFPRVRALVCCLASSCRSCPLQRQNRSYSIVSASKWLIFSSMLQRQYLYLQFYNSIASLYHRVGVRCCIYFRWPLSPLHKKACN